MGDKEKIMSLKKLHLGCGDNYLKGWVNIDIDSKMADLKLDLRKPPPFDNGSTEFIFSEHCIEHLTYENTFSLFKECKRVLIPNGVFRIVTPDLAHLVNCYVKGAVTEWADMGWFPGTSCRMLNEGVKSWGHEFLYDYDELELLLKKASFSKVKSVLWWQSSYAELQNIECRSFHNEIIVEAVK